jgi:3'(2'), 5'-bisphosphate nucleotidase
VTLPSIDAVTELAWRAGEEILRRYRRKAVAEAKSDGSPITEADRAAHDALERGLLAISPSVPVVSEESAQGSSHESTGPGRFWLVDPLDGTKEFLRESDEFTVNVALIDGGEVVLGVVHAPALDRTYRAERGSGAERRQGRGAGFEAIRTRAYDAERPVLVASRSHAGPRVEAYARALGPGVEFTSMGSSLKFCLVAEGTADLYLRDGPTMGWDTAAAQGVVQEAGGGVYSLEGLRAGAALTYDRDDLRNPHFLCAGDPRGTWRDLT